MPSPSPLTLTLTLNGEERKLPRNDRAGELPLPELLEELGFGKIPVLVEHNGLALRARDHAETTIHDGDSLEIIRIVAGG